MRKLVFLVAVAAALALGLAVGLLVSPVYAEPTPGTEVQLPVIGAIGSTHDGVEFTIEIQNVGSSFTKAVIFLFGLPTGFCEPQNSKPTKTECTGILKPGSAWIFTHNQFPRWAKSAIVFSIPVTTACPATTAFPIPPADRGQPLAVEVVRHGPGQPNPVPVTAAYSGISDYMTGAYDPVYGGFMYYAPVIFSDYTDLSSWLYIQNSGTLCTSVELWFRQSWDCLRAQVAEIMALGPGESYQFEASSVLIPGWAGSAWIRSSQPLAIVVDQIGRDVLMSYVGVPAELNYVFNGTPFFQSGSQVLYGPLYYREDQGWDTTVAVQNMSSIVNAKVKVYFLDRSGDIVATLVDWICPRGMQLIFLPVVAPGYENNQFASIGTIRVESQEWWTPGDPKVLAPDINAVAMLQKFEGPAKLELLEAIAYNLFPEYQAFDWQVGEQEWMGTTLIGIPSLIKQGLGLTSELAIQNVVPKPGFTDFAIYIYDQNGLLDFVCEKLNEKQAEYINLDRWGYINPGFKGSAIISATFWEHPVFSTTGQWQRNVVGLAAVKVERSGTVLGSDVLGDESAGSEGFPIPWARYFDFEGPQAPTCPGQPVPCNAVVAGTVYEHDGETEVGPGHLIQIFPEGSTIPAWTGNTDQGGHFTASLPASETGVAYRVEVDGVGAFFFFNGDPLDLALTQTLECTDQKVWELRVPGRHKIFGHATEKCWDESPDVGKLSGATVELWRGTTKLASTTTNSEGAWQFMNVLEDPVRPYHVKICFRDNAGNTVCFETPDFFLDSLDEEFWFKYNSIIPDLSYWCVD